MRFSTWLCMKPQENATNTTLQELHNNERKSDSACWTADQFSQKNNDVTVDVVAGSCLHLHRVSRTDCAVVCVLQCGSVVRFHC